MLAFAGEFCISGTLKVSVPKSVVKGMDFWCSLNTNDDLIACNIIYLGNDGFMQGGKLYNGIIRLPYGDELQQNEDGMEFFRINETYKLHVASQIIGHCRLTEVASNEIQA